MKLPFHSAKIYPFSHHLSKERNIILPVAMFVLNKFNWICNYPVVHLTNWPVCLKKEGNRFITHVWQRKNKLIETFYLLYLQSYLFLVLFYNAVILLLDVVQYTHLMQISQILLPRKYLISPQFKFHLFMLFNRYTHHYTQFFVSLNNSWASLLNHHIEDYRSS